jgi:RNA polymerase sigma factor (sigma-70 family)
MASPDDNTLLRKFADQRSESAFAELVQRHLNLVFSVAMRYAGNPSDAQDITQAVFLILAKKAGSLRQRTTLTGWFYETTRLTASQLCRTRLRQQIRDQEAYMQCNPSGGDNVWHQIAPHLEAAMSRLHERDRTLLALRFYENKTGTEAAQLLGIGADAAHKRTARALEKLRRFFAKHGVTSTTTVIGETIAANSIQAAPVGLASTISYAALSAKTTATALAATKTMTILQKAFTTTATIAAAGAITYALHVQNQFRALQQQQASLLAQIQQQQQQLSDATNQIASLNDQNGSLQQNEDELLRLRAEVTRLHHGGSVPAPVVTQPQTASSSVVQVHVKTRFYSIPDQSWQGMGIDWTADPQGNQMGYLDASQFKNVLDALRGASDVTVLAEPEIVLSNGRRFVASVTQSFLSSYLIETNGPNLIPTNFVYTNLGDTFGGIPYYSTNSATFDMKFDAKMDFINGDPSESVTPPNFQTIHITNDVTFAVGKTLALEEPAPASTWLPDFTNRMSGPRDLLILVTADPIDDRGNLIRHH